MVEKKNPLTSYVEENLIFGKLVFNRSPRNKRRQNCRSFVFIPIEDYDTMLEETMTSLRDSGFIVMDNGAYIEVDDMFAKKW